MDEKLKNLQEKVELDDNDPEVQKLTHYWLRVKEAEARKEYVAAGLRIPQGLTAPITEFTDPGVLTARTEMFRALLKRHKGEEELTPLQAKTCEFVDNMWGKPEVTVAEVVEEEEEEEDHSSVMDIMTPPSPSSSEWRGE